MALIQSLILQPQENTSETNGLSNYEQEMKNVLRLHAVVPPNVLNVDCQRQRERPRLIPEDTIDTHVHIFDPDLGPYSPSRAYTPASARLKELRSFSTSLTSADRPTKFVLVQPSPYGTDNRVLISLLEQFHDANQFVRGIAVVDIDKISDDELWHMHRLGVRGLRLNMQAHGGEVDVSRLRLHVRAAAARIQHLPDWKLQLFVPAYVWNDLYATISSLPVLVIADHTGGLFAASKLPSNFTKSATLQPGFAALIALAKARKVVIKISGLYRSSADIRTGYADMGPIIRELAQEAPDALIWGSDWPHTGEGKDRVEKRDVSKIEPFRQVDNHAILANIRDWVDDEQKWLKLMVENAEQLFA